jgi:dTDP-4-dehydrorhamnose 3,5-epimerase
MKIINTKFKDLKIVQDVNIFDKRGYFRELIIEKEIDKRFPLKVMSFSKKNVLRGMHLQSKKSQGKFVSVIKGEIFDVVIDLRKKSKTFKKKFIIRLSEKNSKSIFIPPGFAHGFYTLAKENYVVYSCTKYRSKKNEISIKWDDKELHIAWPKKNPQVSEKDKNGISLEECIQLLN